MESWLSGRKRPFAKWLNPNRFHRFESYTLRQFGVSNRQGVCTAWKADGSRKGIGVGYLLLRQFNGWLSRAASVLASKAKGACKGMVIDTSATRHLWSVSSVEEHHVYTVSVGSSILSPTTIICPYGQIGKGVSFRPRSL